MSKKEEKLLNEYINASFVAIKTAKAANVNAVKADKAVDAAINAVANLTKIINKNLGKNKLKLSNKRKKGN
ncbi:MAG: hypothetical protein GY797_33480 [Deltaproteobacteria bacterium]|nr:hypothetical protein [Deltaproteobacteria bacterium]